MTEIGQIETGRHPHQGLHAAIHPQSQLDGIMDVGVQTQYTRGGPRTGNQDLAHVGLGLSLRHHLALGGITFFF